jgi:hypothetical protein
MRDKYKQIARNVIDKYLQNSDWLINDDLVEDIKQKLYQAYCDGYEVGKQELEQKKYKKATKNVDKGK